MTAVGVANSGCLPLCLHFHHQMQQLVVGTQIPGVWWAKSFCLLWLLQATPEILVQLPSMGLGVGGCVATTVLG